MSNLKNVLVIDPPSDTRLVEDFAFDRTREVEISWDKVVDRADSPLKETSGTDSIRAFFENLWNFDLDSSNYPTDADLTKAKMSRISSSPVTTIIQTKVNGQHYHIISRGGSGKSDFSPDDFDTKEKYKNFWEKKVDRVEIPNGALSKIEELDLAGPVILRQYRELNNFRVLARKLASKADSLIDGELQQMLSSDEIDRFISQYNAMIDPLNKVEESLIRLKDAASDLGYVLNIDEKDYVYEFPDGTTQTLKPGNLYKPYSTVVSWSVTHRRRVVVRKKFLFWSRKYVVYVPYNITFRRRVIKYAKPIIDLDPWVEKEKELEDKGKESFRFEKRGEAYVTIDNVPLQDVLLRCERDESFWERCVVWIPIYEQKITEGNTLTKYLIIHKPMRGVESISLPKLFLLESLSFKSKAFTRVELGSLVHTINLAPGEQRNITVERSLSRQYETTRTATSLVDLTDATSTSFSAEFEKEARHEKETTKSSNWSVSASGSYGGIVSGSASGGGSSKKNVKQFSKSLHRIARKASRNVTKRTKEEISVSTSLNTSVSKRETTSLDIENTNQGRTLNIAFYQLNNIYKMGLRLEGLRFTVFTGTEDVAGSGIVLPKTFDLDELDIVLDQMSLYSLPLTERNTTDEEATTRSRIGYVRIILLDLIKTLKEYTNGIANLPNLEVLYTWFEAYDPKNGDLEEFEKKRKDFKDSLEEITYSDNAIGPDGEQDVVVGSPGLYADSYVGERPATEPYAEDMRQKEVEMKDAKISEIYSRADALRSNANSLLPSRNSIESALSNDLTSLTIKFEKDPKPGIWQFWIGSHNTGATLTATEGRREYSVSFNNEQDWLSGDFTNLVKLVHLNSRETLFFLI